MMCIAVAAEKGIPLNEAIRGFANERNDEMGMRAARLAETLEAGVALPDAMQHVRLRLPIESQLAARVGYETGTLSESLRRVARIDHDLDFLVRSIYEKMLYLFWLWLIMTGILSFVMLTIVPVFEKMFREFELELPSATSSLIWVCNQMTQLWFIVIPILLPIGTIVLAGSLHYVGMLPRGFPLVSWLTRRVDGALVMRVLAMAVHHSWPMNKVIWLLARLFPASGQRGRLAYAGNQIDNGVPWCDSLRQAGIVGQTDWAVLKAAERVGNIEWALDEMADSSLRRMAYRGRMILNVLFPVTLLIFGMIVASVVVSLFVPLVSLIQGLS